MDLDADRRAFVSAVMRSSGGDKPQRELLEEAVALASTLPAPPEGDDPRTAAEWMERQARGFPRRHRVRQALVLASGIGVVWAAVAGPGAVRSLRGIWEMNQIVTRVLSTICCSHQGPPTLPTAFAFSFDETVLAGRHLSPSELPLIVGDPAESDPVRKWQRIHEAHPESAAHFCAAAMAYKETLQRWPDDFVPTGERLDPGNGWFRLMTGTMAMESAIGVPEPPRITRAEKLAARAKGLPPPRAPAVSRKRAVIDRAAFERGWQELDAALALPRWDDHRRTLDAIRHAAWPAVTEYSDHCVGRLLSIKQPEDSAAGWFDQWKYSEAFKLAAGEAGAADDRAGLERLESRLTAIIRRMGTGADTLRHGLMTRNLAHGGARGLAEGWTRAGDPARAARWVDFADRIDPKKNPRPSAPPDALAEFRGSNMVTKLDFSSSRSPDSAPVTDDELRGGRLAEYALYERLMLHGIAVLLLVALGFLLLAPRRDRRGLGRLPARLAELPGTGDQLAILGLGVVLPAGVYLISTRLPWLSPREFGLSFQGFLLWLAQAVALVVSILLGTLQAARRQLGRRGAVLALGWVGRDPGRLCYPIALAVMPAAAVVGRTAGWWPDAADMIVVLVWGLLGFPLVWLLWQAVGCFTGAAERRLHRATLMHSAAPFVALALVLAAAAIPLVHAEERRWTKQIRYEALSPESSIFESRLEREYGAWIARETLERLDEMK